ncbi:MAG TPA: acyl-CoA dehydrogenase [Candidatus Lokiarchaeia archaeon]|nr:acyl-CoA dehydrogenase [Candidatus Lokiarchaeia archaeon]
MKVQVLKEEIEEKMLLSNLYKLLNEQIALLLTPEEIEFIQQLQEFCMEQEKKIDYSEDVYVQFPALGEHGYIQRLNPWKDFTQAGSKYEMLLGINLAIMDPELDLARLASGILCGNPTFQHGETPELQAVQDELMSGAKVGCIGMTEANRGSDTGHMEAHCTRVDDGFVFDGTKVFTTNGPKADYFIGYGCVDNDNARETMVQAMLSRDMGITTERLTIPVVPRVHIGKTYFNGLTCPESFVTGPPGKGHDNLFDGLVPERLAIVGSSLGIGWSSLLTGVIYCSLREQFGKPIMQYQAVSFPFADLFIRLTSATITALRMAEIYDMKILKAEKSQIAAETFKASAQWSSQIKQLCARLAHEITYETQQLMGGVSVTDNTRVSRTAGVSQIQEVIGGSRGIQQLILAGNLSKLIRGL